MKKDVVKEENVAIEVERSLELPKVYLRPLMVSKKKHGLAIGHPRQKCMTSSSQVSAQWS